MHCEGENISGWMGQRGMGHVSHPKRLQSPVRCGRKEGARCPRGPVGRRIHCTVGFGGAEIERQRFGVRLAFRSTPNLSLWLTVQALDPALYNQGNRPKRSVHFSPGGRPLLRQDQMEGPNKRWFCSEVGSKGCRLPVIPVIWASVAGTGAMDDRLGWNCGCFTIG